MLAIDLKTGRPWSRSELEHVLKRLGLAEKDLIQYHPKL